MTARRTAKDTASAAALGFPEAVAAPTPARMAAEVTGDAASPAALKRLDSAVGELKAIATAPMLRKAVAEIRANNPKVAGDWAIKALEIDERSGLGWYLLAISREQLGDVASSLTCYESALALLPDQAEVANDLGRLAYRLGMKEVAEGLFRHYLARYPNSYEAANNLACVARDLGRHQEAIDILQAALARHVGEPLLWNTLGTVLNEQGDIPTAITFFSEAVRLDPNFSKARYNRGNAELFLGELDDAMDDCEAALAGDMPLDERLMMTLARSTIRICRGDIGRGWDDYEARLAPQFADVTHFLVDRPRWEPGADLYGKRLLVVGEQGLGDEVLFANMVPDILEALGPEGRLDLSVEKRLVPLFQRSFPTAHVTAHGTYKVDGRMVRATPAVREMTGVDLWTPLASPLRQFRRTLKDFPDRAAFLAADPARVDYWRGVLETAPKGPKVGILWKSHRMDASRAKYFSPFEQWAEVLKTPGVSFINMQYGESAQELAQAREELGVEIWNPPGIDLKQDLDEVAALSCALDLTLGFANATTNIAAACGAPVWIISVPGAWTRLGTDHMPWYPRARIFLPPAFGQWGPVMSEVAGALKSTFRRRL